MFSSYIVRSNNSLKTNPPNADKNLSVHGSDWLWAVLSLAPYGYWSEQDKGNYIPAITSTLQGIIRRIHKAEVD